MAQRQQGVVPPSTRAALSDVNGVLSASVCSWLRKHAKGVKPRLDAAKREELSQVFELMDGDSSGSIDVKELGAAFKVLGVELTAAEVQQMVREVDRDGTGEVEWNEFLEIMTESLVRITEDANRGNDQVPFSLMATAYRRKKLLGGLLEGSAVGLAQVIKVGEDDIVKATKAKERQDAAGKHRSGSSTRSWALQMAAERAQLSPDLLQGLDSEQLQAVARLGIKTKHTASGPGAGAAGGGFGRHSGGTMHLPRLQGLPSAAHPETQPPARTSAGMLGLHREQRLPVLPPVRSRSCATISTGGTSHPPSPLPQR